MFSSCCRRCVASWGIHCLMLITGLAVATTGPVTAHGQPQSSNDVVVELFIRADSQQCQRAEEFLAQLRDKRDGIRLRVFDVEHDRDALVRLWQLARRFGHQKAGVPAIFTTNRLFVGFRDDQTSGREIERLLHIRAFVRPGCQHCRDAKEFLDTMRERWPAITVHYYDILADTKARAEVDALTKRYKVRAVSFPCIQVAGRLIVGFQSAETTGAQIEGLFQHENTNDVSAQADAAQSNSAQRNSATMPTCHQPTNARRDWLVASGLARFGAHLVFGQQDAATQHAAPATFLPDDAPLPDEVSVPDEVPLPDEISVPDEVRLPAEVELESVPGATMPESLREDAIEVPLLGRLNVREIGLPAFTFLIGLVDGFNPCAMWVLIFLLSVLVNIKERKKIIIIAGTFVIVSGLAYFAFMAAWFSVFQLIGLLRPVQVGLGLMAIIVGTVNVKDFFAFRQGFSFSIPESAKPGIYRRVRHIVAAKHLTVALLGAIGLAIVVNIIELLCTAGLPALYTEILTMQNLPAWADYSYLALYILAYMLDDTVMVTIVVATLSHRKLQEREGRWLKLLSGSVILLLGTVMIFKPEWLV